MPNWQPSPQEAAQELLRRRAARRRLIPFIEYTFQRYRPAPHHHLIAEKLEAVERGEIDRLMICLPPRHGKALHIDTPIATPAGWSRIGDLRPGDKVFDEAGNPCNVVAVSEVWRQRPVYRVVTDDGDEIIADAEHEWLVRLCRKHGKFALKTTEYLAHRTCRRLAMIAAQGALQLPAAMLPIDPYVLGAWLGDGRTDSAAICSADPDLVAAVSRLEGGHNSYASKLRVQHFRVGPHYRQGAAQAETLQARLRALGVLGNKHIPISYARASREQRLALLQGLVDTAGYVAKDGQIEFVTTLPRLAEDVKELVHSLGHKASVMVGRAKLYGRDCGPKYRVTFYMADAARLERKRVRCRHGIRAFRRYIAVEPCGLADTVCIQVDSPSRMFLAGKSMLPTHNSELASRRFPAWFLGRNPDKTVIAASYNSDLAGDFGREVRNIVASREYNAVFATQLAPDSRAANRWNTDKGGSYVAAGVCTAVTGRGAHVFLIDDPVKDREEADSQIRRDRVREWYSAVAYTRLAPGGAVVLILTRWHEDDLAGWLLDQERKGGDKWEKLILPAIGEDGQALWPERYPIEALERIRRVQLPRDWSALYQQAPAPDEGLYFSREWLRYYDELPKHLRMFGASDYAVTADGGDYTVHYVAGVDPDDNLYIVDRWKGQTASDVWVEAFCDLVLRYKPLKWAEEKIQITRGIGPFIMKRQRERRAYCARVQLTVSRGDQEYSKAMRARSFQARCAQGKVYFPRHADWTEDCISTLLRFPTGLVDDDVDALGLLGRLLDQMIPAHAPKEAIVDHTMDYRSDESRLYGDVSDSWRVV